MSRKVLTVSELVFDVKNRLEMAFSDVAVVGEINSFKAWRSGHWYFDLKDDQSLIPAVMFRNSCSRVKFEVKDGMQVMVIGRVSVYAPQSRMQFMVESIEPVGMGALALAFEQLEKKLELEGLFAESAKKPLPSFPKKVGLVTSPQGAALQDMLRIFSHRMPGINLVIAGTRVQGEGASLEIADAIQRLDKYGNCDVIIVGRGGGSIEDLWAFNEEPVARAIFHCQTPIVSAVGHETDFTIADFVADLRCATPTHAAQTVVPDWQETEQRVQQLAQRLFKQIKMVINRENLRLKRIHQRLSTLAPHVQVAQKRKRLNDLKTRLDKRHQMMMFQAKQRMQILAAKLQGLSPLSALSRGYSAVYSHGSVVTSVKNVCMKDEINIRMKDGNVLAVVEKIECLNL